MSNIYVTSVGSSRLSVSDLQYSALFYCQASSATPRSITTTNLDFATLKCNKPEHTITHVPRKTAKQKVIQINQMETMKKLENLGQENFTGVKNCLLMKIALIVSIVPGSHVLFFA